MILRTMLHPSLGCICKQHYRRLSVLYPKAVRTSNIIKVEMTPSNFEHRYCAKTVLFLVMYLLQKPQ